MLDTSIKPETFRFLADVAANNNRDWFLSNKTRHDAARANVVDFIAGIIQRISEFDKKISPDTDPKSCVMRIYRDVRFSKNKDPYKTNFGAGISEGKNVHAPGYYLHIHPEESFISAGLWMPEARILKAVRQEIDYSQEEFLSIVEHPEFSNYFGLPDQEHALKTVPRDYSFDHPLISYLKLKSFTFTHVIPVRDLSSAGAADLVADGFLKVFPFMQFIRSAVV